MEKQGKQRKGNAKSMGVSATADLQKPLHIDCVTKADKDDNAFCFTAKAALRSSFSFEGNDETINFS